MPTKRVLSAAGIGAAVAGGALAGALLFTPGYSLAGQTEDSTSTAAAPSAGSGFGHRDRHGFGFPGLDAAAAALGMTEDELRDALADGGSIADVAKDKGVKVEKVIDAMVAEATAHIDEEVQEADLSAEEAARLKENLSERVGEFVRAEGGVGRPFGPGGFGPGGHDGPGPHAPGLHGVGFLALDAAAEALGVSEQELRDALADGRSIADVAKDKGVDVEKVIDAMLGEATARIDEQAARLKADLPERISELVRTEGLPGRGGR